MSDAEDQAEEGQTAMAPVILIELMRLINDMGGAHYWNSPRVRAKKVILHGG